MIKITSTQWKNLDGLGDDALQEMRPQAEHTVMKASLYLESTIKRKLTGARSGRSYKVSRTGATHIASAPGEAPAVLFGNLRNSVGHSHPEWSGWTISQLVGPGLGTKPGGGVSDPGDAYARRLEWGGADSRGVMIFPRPYIEPSVQEATSGMNAIFAEIGS